MDIKNTKINTYPFLFIIDLQLFADVHTTDSEGLSDEMKTFYKTKLLDEAQPALIHNQFGDKYPIPKNNGKTIEFRKFNPIPAATTPLQEGVTPKAQSVSLTSINAQVSQYGSWVGLSDILQTTTIDPIILQVTQLLGNQAGATVDTIIREVINGGTSVQYSKKTENGTSTDVNHRYDLNENCPLTYNDIFKAAAQLKSMNAPKINGSYVGIVHPFSSYALMKDPMWIDVHKYANPDEIYNGELGKLAGVRFVESTQAKIFTPHDIVKGFSRLTVKTAVSSSTTSISINEIIPESLCGSLTSAVNVYVNGIENTVTAVTYGASGATLTLGTAVSSAPKGSMICGVGGGKDGSAVFSTLILGSNAYGITELESNGLQHIIKPLGSGDDPLNQRSTCGWKCSLVAKRLFEGYMVRIESGNEYSKKTLNN